jgi:hypothetical protein
MSGILYSHDHLLAHQERVSDELARAQGHLRVGHDVWVAKEGERGETGVECDVDGEEVRLDKLGARTSSVEI